MQQCAAIKKNGERCNNGAMRGSSFCGPHSDHPPARTAEIAAALYVSLNTLKTHVRTVYRKLDVESRADAVDAGRRLGVI